MPIFRNDPEMLVAFRQGRRDALEKVYRYYVAGIEKYARALGRDAGRSELAQPGAVADLVQEVFMRAFSDAARRDYDGQRDFGRYLAAVTRNCFIDLQRAGGREVLIREEDLDGIIESPAGEGDSWCDPRIMSVLTNYVDGLPAPLRALYESRYVENQSQEAASASLGLSRQAIRTGEKRLRAGLRKAMARAGISLREYRNLTADFSTKNSTPAVLARSRT
jgi:RNA polymerase sigma factor (sigma-70 family)